MRKRYCSIEITRILMVLFYQPICTTMVTYNTKTFQHIHWQAGRANMSFREETSKAESQAKGARSQIVRGFTMMVIEKSVT
ncbi:hypothetical protein AG1IA_01227 [Rhizoctonia solani AG-1 IA]|uniref:Uncharacterized protein n=1 Tax=Thanatephorus cucumeris (strain AG1-IA) TaxID=983506 RepID=L8X377_THACA|nr:hypothetical protein AG1IA_01227 [Rhizoctonia solani AG-1 IA]